VIDVLNLVPKFCSDSQLEIEVVELVVPMPKCLL